ncbi:MAG: hypothetical protein MAG795_01249 [Candidatus Woesearchaeota archaeon]|nr:hypothetical protein [Candidatus Woesearchaeota archaeon]
MTPTDYHPPKLDNRQEDMLDPLDSFWDEPGVIDFGEQISRNRAYRGASNQQYRNEMERKKRREFGPFCLYSDPVLLKIDEELGSLGISNLYRDGDNWKGLDEWFLDYDEGLDRHEGFAILYSSMKTGLLPWQREHLIVVGKYNQEAEELRDKFQPEILYRFNPGKTETRTIHCYSIIPGHQIPLRPNKGIKLVTASDSDQIYEQLSSLVKKLSQSY